MVLALRTSVFNFGFTGYPGVGGLLKFQFRMLMGHFFGSGCAIPFSGLGILLMFFRCLKSQSKSVCWVLVNIPSNFCKHANTMARNLEAFASL